MPKRPPKSGYARIAQVEDEEDLRNSVDSDDEFPQVPNGAISLPPSQHTPVQPSRWQSSMRMPEGDGSSSNSARRPRRPRSSSTVDIKAINARLERWAEEIKDKFTRRRVRGKTVEEEQLEIHYSVFQPPEGLRPATKAVLDEYTDEDDGRMSKLEFDDLIEAVRTAIELGVHPKLISQGSSGSYFALTSSKKTVGVFKPKDEEPYANKNPKWTKWLHRNLLPFAFGRAMLIPNLSYVSEAAAYVLDCQLRTNLVPYTDVVNLSSKSFHYDWMDRRAFYRNKRPFPEKPGSFQVFLKGYKGATDFFQERPWPDQPGHGEQEFWDAELQQNFREQLEKLVILDYIMRNTDRGTDNWMIRIDEVEQKDAAIPDLIQTDENNSHTDGSVQQHDRTTTPLPSRQKKLIPRIGAIDNSLSWPWKHPDAWRSYPFGWLFLPVSLIGQPFSTATREHFLPLLTSKDWWSDTSLKLRKCFEIDADFQEKMFARQMAVMKGQAWNVVEALKMADHGPLELTRRNRVLVWDDIVDIPIAVPLVRPSEEMRKRADILGTPADDADEEMDISAALSDSKAPQPTNLLSETARPSSIRSGRNPFNHSRESSTNTIHGVNPLGAASLPDAIARLRPGIQRSRTAASRMSLEIPGRRRRFSHSQGTKGQDLDDEGDLGFAAASTQENSSRKVIVERLEVVKSRQPFFSWC